MDHVFRDTTSLDNCVGIYQLCRRVRQSIFPSIRILVVSVVAAFVMHEPCPPGMTTATRDATVTGIHPGNNHKTQIWQQLTTTTNTQQATYKQPQPQPQQPQHTRALAPQASIVRFISVIGVMGIKGIITHIVSSKAIRTGKGRTTTHTQVQPFI